MAEPPMRRLSDKVLAAFAGQRQLEGAQQHLGDVDVALLARLIEGGAKSSDKRTELGPVIEAYSRLLTLKNEG